MALPKIAFMGNPVELDMNDFMRRSVYDKDNDNVVDKINKITDIQELATGQYTNAVPKVQSSGNVTWDDDEAGGGIDVVVGGTVE